MNPVFVPRMMPPPGLGATSAAVCKYIRLALWRHPTRWHVVAMGDIGNGDCVVAEALCDRAEIRATIDALGGWRSATALPPVNRWHRRRLPIYGETEIDRARRVACTDDTLTDWLVKQDEASDLLVLCDAERSIEYADVYDIDEILANAHEDEYDDLEEVRISWTDLRARWIERVVRSRLKWQPGKEFDLEHRCSTPFVPLTPPARPGVYVIQGVGDYVKIGKAKNIRKRMRDIQLAHPVELRLLAVLSTDPNEERKYHDKFKHLRESGEWFRFEYEIRAAVLEARAAA